VSRRPFRIDGRLVIAAMIALGGVFVVLNLALGGGSANVVEFDRPHSTAASAGVTYAAHLLTGCAPVADFDGRFWAPPGHWRLRHPLLPATIVLRSEERAVLVTGAHQRFALEPLDPPVRLSRCRAPSQSS
jgi:hypothetical protein